MGKIKNFQTSLEALKITFLQLFYDGNASLDMVFSFKKKKKKTLKISPSVVFF
jgi:hypothetical protein